MKKVLLLGLLMGCDDKSTNTTGTVITGADTASEEADADTDADTDVDTDEPQEPYTASTQAPELGKRFVVIWGPQVVDLEIIDMGGGQDTAAPPTPPEPIWRFGMAETTNCKDGQCWTGEDCHLGEPGKGGATRYCHPMGPRGGELDYGAPPQDVTEGETTAFLGAAMGPNTTYYLELVETGECWSWGQDLSYYDALGCTTPPRRN